jgi:hypothetical protein
MCVSAGRKTVSYRDSYANLFGNIRKSTDSGEAPILGFSAIASATVIAFKPSTNPRWTPNGEKLELKNLTSGSLILFGSKSATGGFALDTVFVVTDESQKLRPIVPPKIDEAFKVCTIESLEASGDGETQFTFYRGATYESPVNHGMYSFVAAGMQITTGFVLHGLQFRSANRSKIGSKHPGADRGPRTKFMQIGRVSANRFARKAAL